MGWNFSNIIFIYWFENIVIGIFTVIKMILVKHQTTDQSSGQKILKKMPLYKLSIILFFIFHFGAFTFGHGIFLLSIFWKYINFENNLLIAILAMFFSHGISLVFNYLKPKKYLTTNESILMFIPYPRIFVVHLTVLISGFLMISNLTLLPLIFFVLLKTIVDLSSHLFEHGANNQLKIHPMLNDFLLKIFKTSFNTGQWTKVAKDLDLDEKKQVEDFYRERGINI